MEVVEDFESRPREAALSWWKETEFQREQKMPNATRGQMEGMQGERTMKESSWVQMNQRISGQEEKKCRSGMQKESTMVRCTLLNGSAWSTEKKYMRRYKRYF